MLTHAEYHAACPLPNIRITPTQRKHLIFTPVKALDEIYLEEAGDKPKRLRRDRGTPGSALQAYLDKREKNRDSVRAALQEALNGSAPLSVGVLGKMLGCHRSKLLLHLKALEEQGVVRRKGVQNKTKWSLVKA